MQLGMIGLGRMGANIVRRLMRDGHDMRGVGRQPRTSVAELAERGGHRRGHAGGVRRQARQAPRRLGDDPGRPHGQVVDELGSLIEAGDIIIDGGNSNYRDDVDRAAELQRTGIHYVDIGTSGGVFGLERGYCLMVGGTDEAVACSIRCSRRSRPGAGDIRAPRAGGRPGPARSRATCTAGRRAPGTS